MNWRLPAGKSPSISRRTEARAACGSTFPAPFV
jgi:hypothetical protein